MDIYFCATPFLCAKKMLYGFPGSIINIGIKSSLENNIGRVSSNPREQKSREVSPIIHILTGKQR